MEIKWCTSHTSGWRGREDAKGVNYRVSSVHCQSQNLSCTLSSPLCLTLRLRGGLTGVTRAPLQSHDLVLNVRIAIFEYICLLKSGDFGIFRKLENFEWEEIKNFHS